MYLIYSFMRMNFYFAFILVKYWGEKTGRVAESRKGINGEPMVARGRWHFSLSLRKRKEWRRRERTERKAELSGETAAPLTRVKGLRLFPPPLSSHSSPCALWDGLRPPRRYPPLAYWTRLINQQTLLEWVSRFSRRGPRSCACLCVSRVACCNGQKWTEKWNRTRVWQLAEDGRHAGNPGSAGARTPRSRSRYDASSFASF